MNKKFIVIVFVLSIANSQAQVLFTYGSKQVTKQEFLTAFNKNPSPNITRKAALDEYKDLYLNYKLKVQSAFDEKLNEQASFKAESDNFKRQITENIINEEANIQILLNEVLLRSQKDINLSQIFIALAKDGSDVKQINAAYAELKKGAAFNDVLNKYCTDEGMKTTKGSIGYITAFTLPYEIENVVYALKANGFSAPYKSSYGWHIFKNVEERAAVGKRKIAQILLPFPPNADEATITKIAAQATDIYSRIDKGESFADMAKEFSGDYSTASNGGEVGEVGIGKYETDFESKVFALKKEGEVSQPFKTKYGYHILKLLTNIPVPKNTDDPLFVSTIKTKVENSDRLSIAKKNLVKKWFTVAGYRKAFFNEAQAWEFVDSAWQNKITAGFILVNDSTVLFAFEKEKVKLAEFVSIVRAAKYGGAANANKSYNELLKEFEEMKCGEYYRNHLQEYSASMRQQIKEFDEANLLFAAMDKNVWGKAGEDTTGLQKQYATNKAKYKWQPGVAAIHFSANSKELINTLLAEVKANPAGWRDIIAAKGAVVAADSGRFENGQLPVKQTIEKKAGFTSTPEKSATDESYSFVYITHVYPNTEDRSFEDAKGLIINDYQQVLEQQWIQSLKNKYPVKFNEAVWKTIK